MHVKSNNKNSLKGNRAWNQTKSLKPVLGTRSQYYTRNNNIRLWLTAVYDMYVKPSADMASLTRRLLSYGGLGYNGRISLYSKVGNRIQSGKSPFVIFKTLN